MVDTSKIPQPAGEYKSIKKNGSTEDIIKSINGMDNYYSPKFCEFSQQFSGGKEGLRKLWSFVKYKIKYQKDEFSKSKQIAPPALWKIGKGDCKSKTLFINAVLRCLEIPYIIRYTNYNKRDRHFKHVYTVAIYQGKELPVDSVYDFFGIEKKFNQKKDFKTMPEIIEISGIEPTKRTIKKNFGCFEVGEVAAKVTEIQQKQKYIPKPPPIEFSKISEATASLEIAIRELEIIKVMKPESAKIAEIGLKMLQKAKKGNFCLTGNIPNELTGTAYKIKQAETKQHLRANGNGIAGEKIAKLRHKISSQKNKSINGIPAYVCANKLWCIQDYLVNNAAGTITPNEFVYKSSYDTPDFETCQNLISNNTLCNRNGNDTSFSKWITPNLPYSALIPSISTYNAQGMTAANSLFYQYGKESKYRVNQNAFGQGMKNTIQALQDQGLLIEPPLNFDYEAILQTQAEYDLLIEELNAASGVLDNFVNDIMSANGVENPDGTMGSGLFYSFSDGVTVNNKIISPNRMPGTVTSKKGFQNQFLDSMGMFTGVSRNNVQALARNGVLYDNGGTQPEQTLGSLLAIYENRYQQPGINAAGAVTSIIIAIVGLVTAIIKAVVDAEKRSEIAELEAKRIDSLAATTAKLGGIGASLMPEQNDFLPGEQEEEKRNNLLLLAAAGTVGYIVTKKKK